MSLNRVDLKTTTGSTTEVTKSALPDGASTEAKQDQEIEAIKDIGSSTNPVQVQNTTETPLQIQNVPDEDVKRQTLIELRLIRMHLEAISTINFTEQDIV